MIFTLRSEEAWGLLGAAPEEQGKPDRHPASNRTASLSSDFHAGAHIRRFHLRKNKKTVMKKIMMENPTGSVHPFSLQRRKLRLRKEMGWSKGTESVGGSSPRLEGSYKLDF